MAKTITAVTALLTLTGPALAQPAAETTRPGKVEPWCAGAHSDKDGTDFGQCPNADGSLPLRGSSRSRRWDSWQRRLTRTAQGAATTCSRGSVAASTASVARRLGWRPPQDLARRMAGRRSRPTRQFALQLVPGAARALRPHTIPFLGGTQGDRASTQPGESRAAASPPCPSVRVNRALGIEPPRFGSTTGGRPHARSTARTTARPKERWRRCRPRGRSIGPSGLLERAGGIPPPAEVSSRRAERGDD
jgi:hypothetical protein